jgi:DNA-binding CsgD family transcriptional regulator
MSDLSYLKQWLFTHLSSEAVAKTPAEMLREFELFFTHVFNSSRDGISILDLDFTILGVNHTMERWYAHEMPVTGRKCYEVYHHSPTPCENCPTRRAIETRASCTGIVPFEDTAAVRGSQELSVFPLFDDRQHIFGVIEYVRDITRQREEEEALENLKRRLRFQTRTLQEQEIALNVLLREGRKDEQRVAASVRSNVDALVAPLLERLKQRAGRDDLLELIRLIETRLRELTVPFVRVLVLGDYGLTPRELEVASLVREGKTTKEIAGLFGVSVKAVEFHRLRIREKLGIAHSTRNLASFLRAIH